ncbi:hypothetical protein JQV27_04930 [Sulfitobacter mediterraneus]|uniref:hypothetical protein n=1 Tax=Sulfitobacter mediterraneus TaxID=83219 RepID=UPI00193308C9|nr:hypothetical protein [Sulfitobacter mediterraneus]MBM1639984.1 hypothetical protein [Sulfitobacter mediterraneus]MBM1644033.1 hypothetical protein [Sulfitobacter mediterraneus]MBM1656172.1 hypothetical protein [Sulfitobacter mediterraneus]MBM1664263.1 hypothetical protein [Sulfitobacter mediterraneus]MBM1672354.1 hypothetical protein [Sulfitobacter mediterraneus]
MFAAALKIKNDNQAGGASHQSSKQIDLTLFTRQTATPCWAVLGGQQRLGRIKAQPICELVDFIDRLPAQIIALTDEKNQERQIF